MTFSIHFSKFKPYAKMTLGYLVPTKTPAPKITEVLNKYIIGFHKGFRNFGNIFVLVEDCSKV